jgi:preprotein translocase subunit SecE
MINKVPLVNKPLVLCYFTSSLNSKSLEALLWRVGRPSYGNGATVAYGSPKPLILVRILVPVLFLLICKFADNANVQISGINIFSFADMHICIFAHIFIMNKFSAYLRDSYKELVEKVSWPTWEQLQQSTMIVLGATLFITGLVAIMDFVANGSLKFIYSLF